MSSAAKISNGLLQLPPDALDIVTSALTFDNVVRLYLTGSNILMNRLCTQGGVRTVHLDFGPMRRKSCPPILKKFETIASFRTTQSSIIEPESGTERYFDPSLLPRTLRHLDLFKCPASVLSVLNFEGYFGELVSWACDRFLEDQEVNLPLRLEFLPPNLRRLALPLTISFSDISAIPTTLTSCVLYFRWHLASDATPLMESSFPNGLEHLELRRLPPGVPLAFVSRLPTTLTSFVMTGDPPLQTTQDMVAIAKSLPRGLFRLEMPFHDIGPDVLMALPPKLTSLYIRNDFYRIVELEHLAFLPRSLQNFGANEIGTLPSSLQTPAATLAQRVIQCLPPYLNALPSTVESLMWMPGTLKILPSRNLRRLAITRLNPGYLRLLPTTLETLEIGMASESAQGEIFPPKLTSLLVKAWKNSLLSSLSNSALPFLNDLTTSTFGTEWAVLEHLPATLRSLTITMDATTQFEASFPFWPRCASLTQLTILKSASVTPGTLCMLPPGLRSLNIHPEAGYVHPDSLREMQRFPLLEECTFTRVESPRQDVLLTDDHLDGTLPPSLTRLTLQGERSNVSVSAFLLLPKKLSIVTLPPNLLVLASLTRFDVHSAMRRVTMGHDDWFPISGLNNSTVPNE